MKTPNLLSCGYLYFGLGTLILVPFAQSFSPEQVCCSLRESNSSFLVCQNVSRNSSKGDSSSEECERQYNYNYTCYNLTRIDPCSRNDSGEIDNAAKKKLHIGAFVPQLSRDNRGFFAGMRFAVALINNRSDILEDYQLVLHGEDTHWGGGGYAVKAFFKLLNTGPKKLMLIGPAFSGALEPIGLAAPQWKLLQVSYGAASPKFGKHIKYPLTFRIVPSSLSYSKAKAALIEHYGWDRVAIVYTIDPEYFSPTVEKLQAELDRRNISIIAKEGFNQLGDVSFQMNKLKKLDTRVIIGEFAAVGARKVLCEAYRNNMFGSHYAWILSGNVDIGKVITSDSSLLKGLKCTGAQLQEVMERSIATTKLYLRQDNKTTLSGMTSTSFASKIKEFEPKIKWQESTFAFDSVWAVALTLNKTLATEKTYKQLLELSSHTAKVVLKKNMMDTNFEGITGSVRFDKTRGRQGIVLFKQYRQGKEYNIGQHFTFSDQLDLFKSQKDKIWQDGRPPKDETKRQHDLLIVPLSLIAITWSCASIGVICSLAFLYFNIANGKNRIIKMSSPKLNNLIILGCILCYVSVVLFGLDARFLSLEQYGHNCNVRTAVLSFGFSLAFGAMFSKTWRVHKIFTAAKTLKKMAIRDIHLLGIVAVLLVVDVIFLSVWFMVDPLEANEITFEDKAYREQETIIVPVVYQCTCKYKTYFTATLYAYKGLLILFGLFLAWETRNVTIAVLNDSRYIGMCVYNVVILATIGAIVSIALENSMQQETPYAITSLCLLTCTTVTVLLVFVPKIYQFHAKDVERVTNTTIHGGAPTALAKSGRTQFSHGSPALSTKQLHCPSKATQTELQPTENTARSSILRTNVDLLPTIPCELRIDEIHLDEPMEESAACYDNDLVTSRSRTSLLETRM